MKESYILVVDRASKVRDELMQSLQTLLAEAADEELRVKLCSGADEAVAYAGSHVCPVVFAGDDVPGMDVFRMIRLIRDINRQTNFILLSAGGESVRQALAMKLRLSGCISGRPDVASVSDQLENLWYPLP